MKKWNKKTKKKSTKYKSGFSNLLAESFMNAETAVSKCRLILERILKFNKGWNGRAIQVIVRVPMMIVPWTKISVLITEKTVFPQRITSVILE